MASIPPLPPRDVALGVDLISAIGLPAIEGGTCNPYIQLTLGSQQIRTRHINKNNTNPNWSDRFNFTIEKWDTTLLLEVFHRDFNADDVFLAKVVIPLNDVRETLSHNKPLQDWFGCRDANNKKLQGKILLTLSLTESLKSSRSVRKRPSLPKILTRLGTPTTSSDPNSPRDVNDDQRVLHLKEDIEVLKSKLVKTTASHETLMKQYNKALSDMSDLRDELNLAQTNCSALKLELGKVSEEKATLMESLESSHDKHNKSLEKFEKEKVLFEKQRRRQDEEYKALCTSLRETLDQETSKANQKLESFRRKIRELQAENEDLIHDVRVQGETEEDIRTEIRKLKEELGQNENLKQMWHHKSDFSACERCNTPFTFCRRKVHCRRCGRVICKTCSGEGYVKHYKGLVRVCVSQCPKLENHENGFQSSGSRSYSHNELGLGDTEHSHEDYYDDEDHTTVHSKLMEFQFGSSESRSRRSTPKLDKDSDSEPLVPVVMTGYGSINQ